MSISRPVVAIAIALMLTGCERAVVIPTDPAGSSGAGAVMGVGKHYKLIVSWAHNRETYGEGLTAGACAAAKKIITAENKHILASIPRGTYLSAPLDLAQPACVAA